MSLKVTVIGAKNLASMDSNGFSDPYFYVIFNNLKHKSEVIRKTLNPTWNQSFNYKFTSDCPSTLKIEVWDWDLASSDDFLGEVTIDVRSIASGSTLDLALCAQAGASADQSYVTGTVQVKIDVIDTSELESSKLKISQAALAKMKDEIVRARDGGKTTLEFSSFFLPALPRMVTEQLVHLQKMDLSFNNLSKFPDLSRLTVLEEVNLTGNAIDTLGPEIGALKTLRVLTIDGNALTTISGAIGKLERLEKFEARNNNIATLPKEFGCLSMLEELYLSGNPLKEIPPSFGALRAIKILDLNCCQLARLPEEITLCTRLMDLNLGNNVIEELPKAMGLLVRLVTLNLQNNRLKDIPLSIGKCPDLGQIGYGINIARNMIEDKQMMEKTAVGPDILLDYLSKRYAMAGSPPIVKCRMPTDFGEGPIPKWVEDIIAKEKGSAPQAQAQPSSAPAGGKAAATMDQKCVALKAWITKTIKEVLRPRIEQFRGDVAASPRMSLILDICYSIKDFKTELDKLSANLTFVATPPQSIPPGPPKLETLRAATLAAPRSLDPAPARTTEKLPGFGADKIVFVTTIVQVINNLKKAIA